MTQSLNLRKLTAIIMALVMSVSLAPISMRADASTPNFNFVTPALPDVSTVTTDIPNIVGTIELRFAADEEDQEESTETLELRYVLSPNPHDAPLNTIVINEAITDASARSTPAARWEVAFMSNPAFPTDYDPTRMGFSTPYDVPDDAVRSRRDENGQLWDADDTPNLITVPVVSVELQSNVVVNIPKGIMIAGSRMPHHWPIWLGIVPDEGGDDDTDIDATIDLGNFVMPADHPHADNPLFTEPRRAIFHGVGLENVTMMGEGIIDGGGGYRSPFLMHGHNQGYDMSNGERIDEAFDENGHLIPEAILPGGVAYHGVYRNDFAEQWILSMNPEALTRRPQSGIVIRDSIGFQLYDLTIRNTVRWSVVIELCYDVHVKGIIIRNPPAQVVREADGIDLNTTSRAIVEWTDIETGDDALCIKPQRDAFQGRRGMDGSLGNIIRPYPQYQTRYQHDILMRHHILRTNCNAVKIGTGTQSDLLRMHVHDVVIDNHRGPDRVVGTEPGETVIVGRPGTSAISVQTNDGGNVTDMTYERFTIYNIQTAMFIGVQNRRRPNVYTHQIGTITNVLFRDIVVHNATHTNEFNSQNSGDDVGLATNVTLENITHHTSSEWAHQSVPAFMLGDYPDAGGFGQMPAYGLFARQVNGLRIIGDNTFTGTRAGMQRPMFFFDDVTNYYGPLLDENPPVIAFHLPEHMRFPDREPVFVSEFEVGDQMNHQAGSLFRARNAASAADWDYRLLDCGRVALVREAPEDALAGARELVFLDLPEADYWENYHVSFYFRAGPNVVWRQPANTQIAYRISRDSGNTNNPRENPLEVRHNYSAFQIARANRGWLRLVTRGAFSLDADGNPEEDQRLQLSHLAVGHPERGVGRWFDETDWMRLDLVVDGPFISAYVDGWQVFHDYYDVSWDKDWLDFARRGGIALGGHSRDMAFADITVTLIEPSELVYTYANLHPGRDLFIPIEFNGNAVTRVFNRTTNQWLVLGQDFFSGPERVANMFDIPRDGVTIYADALHGLSAGEHELEIHFNLGGRIVDNRYVREQIFTVIAE